MLAITRGCLRVFYNYTAILSAIVFHIVDVEVVVLVNCNVHCARMKLSKNASMRLILLTLFSFSICFSCCHARFVWPNVRLSRVNNGISWWWELVLTSCNAAWLLFGGGWGGFCPCRA